jgi:hypothetical protein
MSPATLKNWSLVADIFQPALYLVNSARLLGPINSTRYHLLSEHGVSYIDGYRDIRLSRNDQRRF